MLKKIDFKIFIPYLLLNMISLLMITSASSYHLDQMQKNTMSTGVKQGVFLILSLILIAIILRIKLSIFKSNIFQALMIIGSFVLLFITSVLGLGTVVGGAQRWLEFGPFRIQPSEVMMITVILFCAAQFSKKEKTLQHSFFKSILVPALIVGSLIFLTLIQPNVGGAAILTLLFFTMIFASGISYLYFLGGLLGVFIINFLATSLIMFKDGAFLPQKYAYIFDRFAVMKDPFAYFSTNGYQLSNSYIAIHNGGWFGQGLGQSIQKKGFLPVTETDFIFSLITEELGIIASIGILLLLFLLILRILAIGVQIQDPFNSLVCLGTGAVLLIQTFVNLGGILGIIPLTGVPLPFMSYGGSNLLTLSILIGIVMKISAVEQEKRSMQYASQMNPSFS